MQFDLSAVETATMVFIGTLVVAFVIGLFMMAVSFAALVMLGVGRLAWVIIANTLLGLVNSINHAWELLVRHASTVELPGELRGDFQGQSSPSTGTYPRVVLRDS